MRRTVNIEEHLSKVITGRVTESKTEGDITYTNISELLDEKNEDVPEEKITYFDGADDDTRAKEYAKQKKSYYYPVYQLISYTIKGSAKETKFRVRVGFAVAF